MIYERLLSAIAWLRVFLRRPITFVRAQRYMRTHGIAPGASAIFRAPLQAACIAERLIVVVHPEGAACTYEPLDGFPSTPIGAPRTPVWAFTPIGAPRTPVWAFAVRVTNLEPKRRVLAQVAVMCTVAGSDVRTIAGLSREPNPERV